MRGGGGRVYRVFEYVGAGHAGQVRRDGPDAHAVDAPLRLVHLPPPPEPGPRPVTRHQSRARRALAAADGQCPRLQLCSCPGAGRQGPLTRFP